MSEIAAKQKGSIDALQKATDTLSTMLAQEVKQLHSRQRQAAKQGENEASAIRALKETTAVLKDLAAVAKTLNEQDTGDGEAVYGVVLLPPVEGGEET